MNSSIRINPHDFEYLTKSDQEYLSSIEQLYLYNSGQLKNFRHLGPWHQVTSSQLDHIVDRIAAPVVRPCSRGHVKGLWCVEDPDYVTGPKILKFQPGDTADTSLNSTGGDSVKTQTSSIRAPQTPKTPKKPKKPKTEKNKYSIPRKFQVVPKPTPWIIMEPSKKKNFICDDPPDPSYDAEMRSGKRTSTAKSRSSAKSRPSTTGDKSRPSTGGEKSRPSTSGEERYVASPYTTSVTSTELDTIVERVRKPTHASKGGVDLVEKYRNKDYVYGSRNCTPDIHHIAKPTISSNGGKEIAEKFESKDYVYGSGAATPDKLDQIVTRVTKPTVASTGGAGVNRSYTDFVYGERRVSSDEVQNIVERMRRPTVSSEGAIDLRDKKYEYIKPAKVKTNIIIPGLESKFIGRKKVSSDRMQEIIDRLSKLTPAYEAKFKENPHVWKDESARTGPAHVRQRMVAAV